MRQLCVNIIFYLSHMPNWPCRGRVVRIHLLLLMWSCCCSFPVCLQRKNHAAAALPPAAYCSKQAAPHSHQSSRCRSASSCVAAARACCSAAGGRADGWLVPAGGDRPARRADQAKCSLPDNTGRSTAGDAAQPQPCTVYVWQVWFCWSEQVWFGCQ